MSDETPFWEGANRQIVGLMPGPWSAEDWPTEGYDSELQTFDWDARDAATGDPFAVTGHTREEWLALADEMITRWTAWRQHIAALLPPDPST